MLHDYLRAMARRGHVCIAVSDDATGELIDGVVTVKSNSVSLVKLCEGADVIIGQLGKTGKVYNVGAYTSTPTVFIIHSIQAYSVLQNNAKPIIYTSNHTKNGCENIYPNNDYEVCRPIVNLDKYRIEREPKYITLVGLDNNKGGYFLQELAAKLPDVQFLGVCGGYGKQVTGQPDNVTVIEHTTDMASIYAMSKAAIIPSKTESFCRVGLEAMAAGCPVLASDIGALHESFGDAALYLPYDVKQWARAINQLGPDTLKRLSGLSKRRANEAEKEYSNDYDNFEKFLEKQVPKKKEDKRKRKTKEEKLKLTTK